MKKLALFDIDKTLLIGSSGRAFKEAFRIVYGVNTSLDVIKTDGMTDQQIIIAVLKKNGLDESMIKNWLQRCMEEMIKYYSKNLDSMKIEILPGVRDTLEELAGRDVLLGLVTGNLEEIGRAKLNKININRYFKIGGFGSDDVNRAKLVRLAIRRAREYGFSGGDNEAYLFGDTPLDIEAGKEVGVITVGVASGSYSVDALAQSGADYVLKSLTDRRKILGLWN